MGKPILQVTLTAPDQRRRRVPALFDSGSFFSLVRLDCLPSRDALLRYKRAKKLGTAARGGTVEVIGETVFVVGIGKRKINARALVSPNLRRELVIGADTMQSWDISIRSRAGKTEVRVGHDLRDPDVTEVA